MKVKKQEWEQAGTKGHKEARTVPNIMLKDELAQKASTENARTIAADHSASTQWEAGPSTYSKP